MQIILFILGYSFVIGGGAFLWDYITVLSRYRLVPGTVVAYRKKARSRNGGARLLFYPVVEYDINGEKRRLISNVPNGWPIYTIGDTVKVYYSSTFNDDRLKTAASLLVGFIFLVIAAYIYFLIWSIFNVSLLSAVIGFVIFLMVLGLVIRQLRRRNIQSVPDFKKAVKMYMLRLTRDGDMVEDQLITEQAALLNVDLSANQKRYRVGPIFLFLGVLALVSAAYLGLEQWTHIRQTRLVSGRVIGYETKGSDHSLYYPLIAFDSIEGDQEYLFVSSKGNVEKRYAVNTKVPVRYDPQRLAEATIDEGVWNWMGPVVVGLLALIFLAGGAYITRGWLKIRKFGTLDSRLQSRP